MTWSDKSREAALAARKANDPSVGQMGGAKGIAQKIEAKARAHGMTNDQWSKLHGYSSHAEHLSLLSPKRRRK